MAIFPMDVKIIININKYKGRVVEGIKLGFKFYFIFSKLLKVLPVPAHGLPR